MSRVLLAGESGDELLALRPWWERHETSWVAGRNAYTEAALAGQRVCWRPEPSWGSRWAIVAAAWRTARLIRRERPAVVIAAGDGSALAAVLAARVLRVPAVWVEPLTATAGPPRLGARLASAVLVQDRSLMTGRSRAVFVGELY